MRSTVAAPGLVVGPSRALWAARALLALLGLAVTAGAIYFTFFASAAEGGDPQGLVEWALGVWGIANGVAFIVVAVLLRHARPKIIRIAQLLVVAHLVFSAIKIAGYGETEAVAIVVVDLAILALLEFSTRGTRS